MKATQATPEPPIDYRARCNLAASILNQREPSWHTAHVAKMALNGASIDGILAADTARAIAAARATAVGGAA